MENALITVESLSLERGGRQLLHDFALKAHAGDIILIEGENGAGKTSLLRALAGLSRFAWEGSIRTEAQGLLYLGHKPGVKQVLSARENLAWFCSSQGLPVSDIDAALNSVGLYGYEDVLCQSMSAGQQRRVNLARLYISRSPLWLLDEPFTSIDRDGVAALGQTLVAQARRGGAVIMTSHQDLQLDYPVTRVRLAQE